MRPIAVLGLVGLSACTDDQDLIPLHFDGPVAAAVLPGGESAWRVPTGYVANSRNGRIVPLDLVMGRLLTDSVVSSFVRAGSITTGQTRLLADVAVVGGEDGSVTLWAVDSAYQKLLRVPYVLSVDEVGDPVVVEPTATDPVFVDADGSGDDATLTDLHVRRGFTTTEDWSIEYDGTRWWAKGSRSGVQVKEPIPGEDYQTDEGELTFVIDGDATEGDRFDFHTDTGVVEYDLGALPTGVLAVDGRVYVSVASDPGEIVVYDGVTGDYVGGVVLGEGAQPTRMSAAPDGRVFVADGLLPQVWVLRFDEWSDPASVPVETIALPAPAIDVAWQGGYDRNDQPFDELFVAPIGLLRVDVYDLDAGSWVDPNPYTQEVEGVYLGSPVSGLGASAGEVWLPHETEWGASPRVPVVGVSTADGYVYMLEGGNGCAVMDETGPYAAPTDSTDAFIYLDDQGAESDPELWIDDATGWQVVASDCGGVARSEIWTVTYDSATVSWEVEGSLSGVQVARAREGERYVSDTGAISFVIGSGSLPATDGDRFAFSVDDGLRVFKGSDENEDGVVDPAWRFPGRPVGFETLTGPTGGGWDQVDRRQYLLLPVTDSDFAARLFLDSGATEVRWN